MATYIKPRAIKDGTISASKTDETIATKEELTELSLKVGELDNTIYLDYNTMTFEQVQAAVSTDKMVGVIYEKSFHHLSFYSASSAIFACATSSGVSFISMYANGYKVQVEKLFESTTNKKNTINPASTTEYPSSKAVADYVAEQGRGDNYTVICDITTTEDIGEAGSNQSKFLEFTTDENGTPLVNLNIKHIAIFLYIANGSNFIPGGIWCVNNELERTEVKHSFAGNLATATDTYPICMASVVKNQLLQTSIPANGGPNNFNSANLGIQGAYYANGGQLGDSGKIEKLSCHTSYPNGTIWPAGSKIKIIGW